MKNEKPLLEKLANLEHKQWMKWSKSLIKRLKSESPRIMQRRLIESLEKRWKPNWKSYCKLPEDIKEHDRKWARKVLKILKQR